MIHLVINEHDRVFRLDDAIDPVPDNGRIYLKNKYFKLLQRFDLKYGAGQNDVFTWYADHVKAKQWVGVVQLPGLLLEILPKVDDGGSEENAKQQFEARRNLLYMLSISGDVPVRSRDMAKIANRKAPLSETLCSLFAKRLLSELLRGINRSYVEKEENIRTFKGRLVINKHLLKNSAHRERFFCRFDEFSSNTPLNRVLKSAARVMTDITCLPATQETLKKCLILMENVNNEMFPEKLFDQVVINRQNIRFQDLYSFSKLILTGYSPTVSAGKTRNFSLLFDMNIVFERFVAGFIQKYVMNEFSDCKLFPQAVHNRRYLMQLTKNRGVLSLAPDLLIKNNSGKNLILDTKWKRTDTGGVAGGVKNNDLYQLFAYTHRYGCEKSILLYPKLQDSCERNFDILNENNELSGKQVCVRFIDLNRNFYVNSERDDLKQEIIRIIENGFCPCLNDDDLMIKIAAGGV